MIVRTKQGKQITLETSWDDGRHQDMALGDMLIKYKLPATFYIPSIKRELMDHQIRFLANYFDIGGHTVNHMILTVRGHEADAWTEIAEGKRMLELVTGKHMTSFCYPRGKYNNQTKMMVAEAGFTEGRTTTVGYTTVPPDPFARHTTVHAYPRAEYGHVRWEKYARTMFDRVIDPDSDDDYFHLWGHSWEVDRENNWKQLDQVFAYIHENLHLQ